MRHFKLSVLIVICGILMPTLGCQAQVSNADEQIAGAVLAAP